MKNEIFKMPVDCEIVSTRVFEFPIELVFRAWTDAEHLKNWRGPKGFTNTFEEFDFRVGEKWRFVFLSKRFRSNKQESFSK